MLTPNPLQALQALSLVLHAMSVIITPQALNSLSCLGRQEISFLLRCRSFPEDPQWKYFSQDLNLRFWSAQENLYQIL